jgi:hypothetical protein
MIVIRVMSKKSTKFRNRWKQAKFSYWYLALIVIPTILLGVYLIHRSHAYNADINGDGVVGIADLSVLAANYNKTGRTFSQGDINGDGATNIADLSILAANWGTTVNANLSILSSNPRYLTNGNGKALFLTGYHIQNNFKDRDSANPPAAFDYTSYLDSLVANKMNFIRLWEWEESRLQKPDGSFVYESPQIYNRSTTSGAADGGKKFDLSSLNQAYFDRLKTKVEQARSRGIYVGVMLFNGWSANNYSTDRHTWRYHPYNASNNVNAVNGDTNGNDNGEEVDTLSISAITKLQEAYVNKLLATLKDEPNVIYEVANETLIGANTWQEHFVNFVQARDSHLIGMTSSFDTGSTANSDLDSSPADWIAYGALRLNSTSDTYIANPPATSGRKVVIIDSDHLGVDLLSSDGATTRGWVWKSFLRGYSVIQLDDSSGTSGLTEGRKAMRLAQSYASRIDLAHMTPQNSQSSTAYALVNSGKEYLVYQPGSGAFTVNLPAGTYNYEWLNTRTGAVTSTGNVTAGGGNKSFSPTTSEMLLYLKK